MLVPLMLVLALHAADQNDAEQQFRQMDMKLTNAKTLECTFEAKLEKAGILTRKKMDQIREAYNQQMLELSQQVKQEPLPDPSTIYDHVYAGQKGKYW